MLAVAGTAVPVTSAIGGTGREAAPVRVGADAGVASAVPAASTPAVTETVSTAAWKVAYLPTAATTAAPAGRGGEPAS